MREEELARGKQVFGLDRTYVDHVYILGEIIHGRKDAGLKTWYFFFESDATTGAQNFFLMLELLGAPYVIRNTTYEICGSTPESLFHCGENISWRFAEGNAQTHTLGYSGSLGAPESDKISRNKCIPTVALL